MAGKRKRPNTEEHFGGKRNKRAKNDKTKLTDNLTTVFDNPGFSHVAQKIFSNLDHNEQLKCRLVCKSWKTHLDLDQPFFWIKKLNKKGQSKKLRNSWNTLLQRIEKGSLLEKELIQCLKQSYKNYHLITQTGLEGIDAIHVVAMFGCINLMKTFTDDQNHSKTDNGWTPIHMGANNGRIAIVKYLTSKVENLNVLTHDGWTAIRLAVLRGHTEIVKFLANKLDNPNSSVVPDRWSPIQTAARYGHTEIVKFLANTVDNPNAPMPNGWTPLQCAARYGHTEIVKFLANKVDNPNAPMPNGMTPLIFAARHGYTEIVKCLATKVDHPNAPLALPNGWTPLQYAAMYGHTAIFKYLVAKVPNPNAPTPNQGISPIQMAAQYGHTDIVKFLVTKVENPNAPKPDGWTPLQLAIFGKHIEVVKILMKAIVKKLDSDPDIVMEMFKRH